MDDVAAGGRDPVQEHDRRVRSRSTRRRAGGPAVRPRTRLARWRSPRSPARRQAGASARARCERLLQVLDVLVVEPQQGEVAVAHDSLGVDDEDRAAHQAAGAEHAVGPDHRPLGVGEQRHCEPVPGPEALVGVERLRGDAQHLGVELVQPVGRVAVGAELPGAHRREVARDRTRAPASGPDSRRAG